VILVLNQLQMKMLPVSAKMTKLFWPCAVTFTSHVLGVYHDLHAERMLHLVAPAHRQDLLPHLAVVYVVHHALRVKVGELDGDSLEGVAIGHVVLNGRLEFVIGESLPGDPLKLVVGQRRGQQVGELGVEARAHMLVIQAEGGHLVS
jgi:hypothetical protein